MINVITAQKKRTHGLSSISSTHASILKVFARRADCKSRDPLRQHHIPLLICAVMGSHADAKLVGKGTQSTKYQPCGYEVSSLSFSVVREVSGTVVPIGH